jgi:hypothetical protein
MGERPVSGTRWTHAPAEQAAHQAAQEAAQQVHADPALLLQLRTGAGRERGPAASKSRPRRPFGDFCAAAEPKGDEGVTSSPIESLCAAGHRTDLAGQHPAPLAWDRR